MWIKKKGNKKRKKERILKREIRFIAGTLIYLLLPQRIISGTRYIGGRGEKKIKIKIKKNLTPLRVYSMLARAFSEALFAYK